MFTHKTIPLKKCKKGMSCCLKDWRFTNYLTKLISILFKVEKSCLKPDVFLRKLLLLRPRNTGSVSSSFKRLSAGFIRFILVFYTICESIFFVDCIAFRTYFEDFLWEVRLADPMQSVEIGSSQFWESKSLLAFRLNFNRLI